MTEQITNKPTLKRIDTVSYDVLVGKYGKLWRDDATRDELIGYADWMEAQINVLEMKNKKLEHDWLGKNAIINQNGNSRIAICDALRVYDLRLNPDDTLTKVEKVVPANHPQFRPITTWFKVIPSSDGEIVTFNHIENGHTAAKNPTLAGKLTSGEWVNEFKWLNALGVVVGSDQA